MFLKDLLKHFKIEANLPVYLLEESFNPVFLKGEVSKKDSFYEIISETQKNVIHTMYINRDENYPVIVMSQLPNGSLNGIKFGLEKNKLKYINEL